MRTRNTIVVEVVVYKEGPSGAGLSIDSTKRLVVKSRDNSDAITLITPGGEEVIVASSELEDAVRRCQ